MRDSGDSTATFVRGFFNFLDEQGYDAAVLHGWRGGFEGPLSDVDFVLNPNGFNQLVPLLDAWCDSQGWLLCQVLRHESTAAYCVCSSAADPRQVVALDACSDYRRNESILIPAADLLIERVRLTTGGYRVADEVELRYRFAKAAAKDKDPQTVAAEFSCHAESSRVACRSWLLNSWNIPLDGWDASSLGRAIQRLRSHTHDRPPLTCLHSLRRIASRVLHPSGMIVVTAEADFESTATMLENAFGRLHFRRFLKSRHWQPSLLKDLITSTLIVVTKLPFPWSKLIPVDCMHHLNPDENPEIQCMALAKHLHERCKKRENL